MFGISYSTWKEMCRLYFSQNSFSLRYSLQWYPFSKNLMMKEVMSKDFFTQNIENGYCLFSESVIQKADNLMQKGDGSYRQSQLISPIMFLIIQSICKEISGKYIPLRESDITTYYAGDLKEGRVYYKKDYDLFYKEINAASEAYEYYYKTDLNDFFRSINIDLLFDMIMDNLNKDSDVMRVEEMLKYKGIFNYFGNYGYPVLENSVGTSYVATMIYLEPTDNDLYGFLSNAEFYHDFKMIRYVDDLYILFNTDKSSVEIKKKFSELLNYYSTILSDYNLALSYQKCKSRETKDISKDLKLSLYDESVNEKEFDLHEINDSVFIDFLGETVEAIQSKGAITSIEYFQLVNEKFHFENVERTAIEIYHHFIYSKQNLFRNEEVKKMIQSIAHVDVIAIDTKRLTSIILKTKDGLIIRQLLDELFQKKRVGYWCKNDTAIVVYYLIQRGFKHPNLLTLLEQKEKNIHNYYENYCSSLKWDYSIIGLQRYDIPKINLTNRTIQLYFLYLINLEKKDYLISYAYYKNFFDRVTAEFAFYKKPGKYKKPRYQRFYAEKHMLTFYAGIKGSKPILKKAHKIRNSNPVSHSSSELLDSNNSKRDILENIKNLEEILKKYYFKCLLPVKSS